LAQERLSLLPDGLVRITLRKPFRDGAYAIDMDPLSLLCRLATTIPPPRMHVVHDSGVLAPAAKLRPLIVPPPTPASEDDAAKRTGKPPTQRCVYIPWALLAKKTFKKEIDRCPKCQGKRKLKALIQEPESIASYLRHLGEPTEPPPLTPARAPPYCRVRELRRKPQAQTEMFDA
jgi:Putative transposase